MATYLVTAIGAPFQKHNDILGHREHKDTEKNTLQVARSTRRRRAAGEACQPQTNDHWTVARSFVCGLRASRRGLRCRPTGAPRGAPIQRGASPLQASALRPETNDNCAAMRRGGEQSTVVNQSVGNERDSAWWTDEPAGQRRSLTLGLQCARWAEG